MMGASVGIIGAAHSDASTAHQQRDSEDHARLPLQRTGTRAAAHSRVPTQLNPEMPLRTKQDQLQTNSYITPGPVGQYCIWNLVLGSTASKTNCSPGPRPTAPQDQVMDQSQDQAKTKSKYQNQVQLLRPWDQVIFPTHFKLGPPRTWSPLQFLLAPADSPWSKKPKSAFVLEFDLLTRAVLESPCGGLFFWQYAWYAPPLRCRTRRQHLARVRAYEASVVLC